MIADSRALASPAIRETLLGGLVLGAALMLFSRFACTPKSSPKLFCVEPSAKLTLDELSVFGFWQLTAFLMLAYLAGSFLGKLGDVFVPDREPLERTRQRIKTVGLSGNELLITEWKDVRRFQDDLRSVLGTGFIIVVFCIIYLILLLIEALTMGSAEWITSRTSPFTGDVIGTLLMFFCLIVAATGGAFFAMKRVVKPWAAAAYEARLRRLDALGGLPNVPTLPSANR